MGEPETSKANDSTGVLDAEEMRALFQAEFDRNLKNNPYLMQLENGNFEIPPDEEVSDIAVALRERLSALKDDEFLEKQIDDTFNDPNVRDHLKEQGVNESDIPQIKKDMILQIKGAISGLLNSPMIENTINSQIEKSLDDMPRVMNEVIQKRIGEYIDETAAEIEVAQQRLQGFAVEYEKMKADALANVPTEDDVKVMVDEQVEKAAQVFANQFAAMKDADPEHYNQIKDMLGPTSPAYKRAFEIVEENSTPNPSEPQDIPAPKL